MMMFRLIKKPKRVLAGIFAALVLAPTPAAAVEPGTVFVLVSAGVNVAKMFAGGGPGIGALLALQTEMLVAISQSLKVIQAGMTTLFHEIQNLESVVHKLPEETVIELCRAELMGALRSYDEVLKTFDDDRDIRGVDYANTYNREEFEGVVTQVRKARDILFSYENELTIPILAAAMQGEIHCMIMVGERDTRIRAALESYREWFGAWLDEANVKALPAMCKQLASDLDTALIKRDEKRVEFIGIQCIQFTNVVELPDPAYPFPPRFRPFEISGTTSTTIDIAEVVETAHLYNNEAGKLNQNGGSVPDSFFKINNYTLGSIENEFSVRGYEECRVKEQEVLDLAQKWSKYWPNFTGSCSNSVASIDLAKEAKNVENIQFNIIRQKILAYYGFLLAARSAVSFCDKMLLEVNP